jgi:comEA protein
MKDFFNNLNFTKSETRVVIFISVCLIIGAGYRMVESVLNGKEAPYDFTRSDSVFKVRSEILYRKLSVGKSDSETSSLNDTTGIPEDKKKLISVLDSIDRSGINRKIKKGEDLIPAGININTASAAELQKLPGVGKKTAESILEFRSGNSKFNKIEDIMKIKGIGKKKFEKMKDFITVNTQ